MEASEPWGGLEQSIARGSAVEAAAYEFLDQDFQLYANMQQAMDRREKCRSKLLMALKRAGASEDAIQQVTDAMDRPRECIHLAGQTLSPRALARTGASDGGGTARSSVSSVHGASPKVDPTPRVQGRDSAGIGCNLERNAAGDYFVSRVIPDGACAQHGIRVGSVIRAVDGEPLRGKTMSEVREMCLGLPGTHVSVRYTSSDNMDDMEEKILTRVRTSSRRGSGLHSARSCASHVPGVDLTISREHQHETQHKSITDSSDDSMKNVLTTPRHGLSSQEQQTTFAKDMRYLKQLGASILGFKVSDAESTACMGNSQMASDHGCERPGSVERGNRSRRGRERADFLCALDSCDFNRDSQSAMSTARTSRSHVSQVGVRRASEEDKVARPESVSNRDLQRAVAVLLKRRSDHVPIREHVHARTEGKHRMSRQLPQDDLDRSAREQSQNISSSSVLCTEGLQSGKDYLYQEDIEDQDLSGADSFTAQGLRPVVLEQELDSLRNKLYDLDETMATLAENAKIDSAWAAEQTEHVEAKASSETQSNMYPMRGDDGDATENNRLCAAQATAMQKGREDMNIESETLRCSVDADEAYRGDQEAKHKVESTDLADGNATDDQKQKESSSPTHYVMRAPGTVKICLQSATDLPKMDIMTGSCDAYCKILLAGQERKSKIIKNNRNPTWNEELSLEIAEAETVQSDHITFDLWDWNAVMSHSRIGSAQVPLSEVKLDATGTTERLCLDISLAKSVSPSNATDPASQPKLYLTLTSDSLHPAFALAPDEGQNLHGKHAAEGLNDNIATQDKSTESGSTGHPRTERDAPLPEGWKAYWSKTKNKPYYKHKASGTTVWSLPSEQQA